MTIVFSFDSVDPRRRSTLVLATPELAAGHVTKVLNGGRRRGHALWTLDPEGRYVPTLKGMIASLRHRSEIKLYDQGAWNSDDSVTIETACGNS